jgi:Zn-dependent protease
MRRHETESDGDLAEQRGLRLGRVFGVEILADWSLAIIFTLIVVSLAVGVFPAWHPDWGAGLAWAIALLAAVLFFGSITVHELSHAVVGRAHGIPVRRITLFIFGGMAHMERQPPSARSEFLMAAVGPVTSMVIGVVSTTLGLWLVRDVLEVTGDPAQILAAAGPGATIFLWLGPINILLAIFNMIPGFPLDGGRVFRAILWWATGDLERSTRYASRFGQGFAYALIAVGVLMAFGFQVPVLGAGLLPGLWLVIIGWFLNNAARMSYEQVLIAEALEGIPVSSLMRQSVAAVSPGIDLETFIRDYYMSFDQQAFPVTSGDDLLGLVTLDDVREVPRERWPAIQVAQVMTTRERLRTVSPDSSAFEAFKHLGVHNQLPVVEGGRLRGMLRREDLLKWLALRSGAPGAPDRLGLRR